MEKLACMRRNLTARQNKLVDYLLAQSHPECGIAFDELQKVLAVDGASIAQCLRDDLKAVQRVSAWVPVENGEKLVGLIDRAELDTGTRTVRVWMSA